MLCSFGILAKEINSTKLPDLDTFTEMNVQLKDDVSILNPIILIHDSNFDKTWNYCWIEEWGRFYFLHDAVITTGMIWEVELAIDVMASYRGEILASNAYVRRSASDYNYLLPDPTWSHTTNVSISHTTVSDSIFNSTGSYLLFTASDDGQTSVASVPSMSVYSLSAASLKGLCNYLFSDSFINSALSGVSSVESSLAKTFFNPFQYVVKCLWIPFLGSELTRSEQGAISFGWWAWPHNPGSFLTSSSSVVRSFTFTPGGTVDDWTDKDPAWSKSTLYVPGFGQIDIAPDYYGQTLTGKIIMDIATGEGGLFIKTSGGALVASATGQLGAEVQLSSLYKDVIGDFGTRDLIKGGLGAVSSAAGAVGKFLTNGGIMGALRGGTDLSSSAGTIAENAVSGAQAALQPTMSTIGANGTRAIIMNEKNIILTTTKYTRYSSNFDTLGGVCNKTMALGDLSGYTEVVNPNIYMDATSGEISMVNNFLTGGFYIE